MAAEVKRYVYIALRDNLVKIGCSSNPKRRMRAFHGARLIWHRRGDFKDERALHVLYGEYATSHNEWFRFEGRLEKRIARLFERRGDYEEMARMKAEKAARMDCMWWIELKEAGDGRYDELRRMATAMGWYKAVPIFRAEHNV